MTPVLDVQGTTYSSFEGAVQKLQKTHSHKPGKVVMLVLADPLAYLAALLSIFGRPTPYHNAHSALQLKRVQACKECMRGPVTLVVGCLCRRPF